MNFPVIIDQAHVPHRLILQAAGGESRDRATGEPDRGFGVVGLVAMLAARSCRQLADITGGDLMLEVGFAAHPVFAVDGRDIACTVNVAPWEAALGGRIPVPTLGGTVELNVPAGAQGGRKFRLKGRGLPGTPAGDQTVTLRIVTPPPKDDTERGAYEALSRLFEDFDPRKVT